MKFNYYSAAPVPSWI